MYSPKTLNDFTSNTRLKDNGHRAIKTGFEQESLWIQIRVTIRYGAVPFQKGGALNIV